MSLCSFTEKVELNAPIEKVFQYLSDTEQFERVYPSLQPKVIRRTSRHLNQGASTDLQLNLFGIPTSWKIYTHSFNTNRHIACIWHSKLVSTWEHDYYFESIANNQTRLTECVLYRLPFGVFGTFLNRLFVRSYLQRIFKRRRKILISTFQDHRRMESSSKRTSQEMFKITRDHQRN